MRKIYFLTIIIIILLSIISCSHSVQVYETKPTSLMNYENDSYTFENDTVKIIYNFWAKHGTLSYTVYNKLNIPIYIDWKKSSYVKNSEKLDYWMDITNTKSVSKSHGTVLYGQAYGNSYNSSTSVKPEHIVFIAPKSSILKDQFILFSLPKLDIPLERSQWDETKRKDKPEKDIQIQFLAYTEANSPLRFRNFLTISTSDKFDKEAYIDNGFYVSKVSEMDRNNFWGTQLDIKGANPTTFMKGSSFYIELK